MQTLLILVGLGAGAILVYLVAIGFVLDLTVPPEPLGPPADREPEGPPAPRSARRFDVDGTSVHAWLYLPAERAASVPCIVMAHGFGGTKNARLDAYAARFRAEGWAVLVFDYRHFGESDGEPRQLFSVPLQLEDWASAVQHARGLPEVDATRIALWGTSASGGHVVSAAAADAEIAAVSAQCPGLDPKTDGRALVRRLGVGRLLRLFMHAQRDLLRSRFGASAHRLPIVGRPGSLAILNAPDAYEGYAALVPEGFRNEVCARVIARGGGESPLERADRVRCPVLIQSCDHDSLVSSESAEETVRRLGDRGTLLRYPIGHFDIYVGAPFETAVRDQIAFFHKHLG